MARSMTTKKSASKKSSSNRSNHRKSKILKDKKKVKAKSTSSVNAQSHSLPNLMMYRGPNYIEELEDQNHDTNSLICFYTPKKHKEDIKFQLNCLAIYLDTRRNQLLEKLKTMEISNCAREDSFSLLFVPNQECIGTVREILEDETNKFCNKNHSDIFLPRNENRFDTFTAEGMVFNIHQSNNSVLYSMDGRSKRHLHVQFYVHLSEDKLLPNRIKQRHIKQVVDYIQKQKNLSLFLGSYFINAAYADIHETTHLIQPVFSHNLISQGCKKLQKNDNQNILPLVVYKGDASFKTSPQKLQFVDLPCKKHIEQVYEQHGGVLLHGNACVVTERECDIRFFAAYHDVIFSCNDTLKDYQKSASLKSLLEKAMEARDSFFLQDYVQSKIKKKFGLYGIPTTNKSVTFPQSIENIWYGLQFILDRDAFQIIKSISKQQMEELINTEDVIDSCTRGGQRMVSNLVDFVKEQLSASWIAYNQQKEKSYLSWCKDYELSSDEMQNSNLLDNRTLVNEVIGFIRILQVLRLRYAAYLSLCGSKISYREHKIEDDEVDDDESDEFDESDEVDIISDESDTGYSDSDSDSDSDDESDGYE